MQTVFFHTFGCRTNQYDSESIREQLEQSGYQVTEKYDQSDLCVINSCSVTAEADRKCRQFVRKVLRSNSQTRIIVTGCYATRAPEDLAKISPRIEIFSNQQKKSIAEIVSGCSLVPEHSTLIKSFNGRTRAFVKVQDGCDAKCTYCIIPSVRPIMESRSILDIKKEIKNLVQQNFKEVVLTGIRLGSYGLTSSGGRVGNNHGNLVELLKELMSIDGNFRIRLSSLEITELTSSLIQLVSQSSKICPHFHIPLQSADNTILKKMGRWYDMEEYEERILEMKRILPEAGLTTDVIVGFPGENDEHFFNTYHFLEKYFDGLHVFPFSERPGTAAVKLKNRCSPKDKQNRVQKLLELDLQLRKNFQNRFLGQQRILLAESDGGFTDNGIRLFPPFPFTEGKMEPCLIPAAG